jgi:hypothetical protein
MKIDEDLHIENHPEIERLGSRAAYEYMKWHEKELETLALSDKAAFHFDREHDRRLYLSLRSNISLPMVHVGGTYLKSERWANLLMCMLDRIPDFNFITLLRPDASKTYDEQRDELLVVPRAQFVLVEIARAYDGCYGLEWRSKERVRLSRERFGLVQTKRFSTISSFAEMDSPASSPLEQDDLFQRELKRQVEGSEKNTAAAKRGDQLDECVSAKYASDQLVLEDSVLRIRLGNAIKELDGGRRYVVVDNVLDKSTVAMMEEVCLEHFAKLGDSRISAQVIHRQDDVCFLPLFQDTLDELRAAKIVLSNIAGLSQEHCDTLLVPEVGQLALYDGQTRGPREKPGYVAHLDNCKEIGGKGENYRELTAILYLNEAPEGANGGSLLCYETMNDWETGRSCEEVTPKAGLLVLFKSRHVWHEVTPVVGWRRLALSVWMLKDSRNLVQQ